MIVKLLEIKLRQYLINVCEKSIIGSRKKVILEQYVKNEITYEQLLNLVFNPYRKDVYLSKDIIENIVLEQIRAGKVLNELTPAITAAGKWLAPKALAGAKFIISMVMWDAGFRAFDRYVLCRGNTVCFKIKQGEAIINKLQQKKHECSKTDNPPECTKIIDQHIRTITQQIVELKTKQRELTPAG